MPTRVSVLSQDKSAGAQDKSAGLKKTKLQRAKYIELTPQLQFVIYHIVAVLNSARTKP